MKKIKKRVWIASLLAALSVTAVAGSIAVTNDKTIVTTAASWQFNKPIDNTYLYGTSFRVPKATVEVNGENVAAISTVVYPDGTATNATNIPLNQAGQYTINYRALVDGEHYLEKKQFTVQNSAYVVQSEASSVRYGDYTELGADSEGLLVRLAQNDTLTFAQLIDVSALTGAETLFETFITPNMRGAYDFNQLFITLTDAEDSSVYLTFRLSRYIRDDRGVNMSYVAVYGNGQAPVGYESGANAAYHIDDKLGTPLSMSFSAVMHQNNAWSGPVVDSAPDAGKCTLAYNPFTMEAKATNKHVAHLNNLNIYEKAWSPWPSGKARLTISAKELKSETANFCITEIFGLDLQATTFEEKEEPIIDVSMEQKAAPKGEVGRAYKIPSATAFDYYSGECEVKTSVYRDYVTGSDNSGAINVSVIDGEFFPTVSGWHTIVYTATDAFGNTSEKLLSAYIADNLGDITLEIPSDAQKEALLGSWISVPKVTYTGDCGKAFVEVSVTHDGKTVSIEDGFLPEVAGEYIVTYTVTDYIGRVGTDSYTITAIGGEEYVVLDKLVLPQVFVSDCEYVLPEIYAIDYSSGKAEKHLCSVVVTDKNQNTYTAGESFTPSVAANGDKVKISYQYDGTELIVEEVPAVLVKGTKNVETKNYLYGEGFTTSFKEDNGDWIDKGVVVLTNGDSDCCGWTFATPQIADGFLMEFQGIASRAKKFDALRVTFTDSQNKDEQIAIEATVETGGTTIKVGETVVSITSSTLVTDKKYSVSYNAGKIKWDDTGFSVEKTVKGEAFNGFTSGFVYVHVEMLNAREGAGYKLLNVCGSWISRYNMESYAPNFKLLGEFSKEVSINTVYELYPAIANDVFAPNTQLTMTVTAPDGTIVVDKDGVALKNVQPNKSYFISLSQYGQYKATYRAVEKDWVKENPLESVQSIFVIDEVAPEITFTNATQTTAKVGDVLVLPDFVVNDNLSSSEHLRIERGVFTPAGKYIRFKENENAIRCAYAGEYVFIVMVFDEQNNLSTIKHVIMVAKG